MKLIAFCLLIISLGFVSLHHEATISNTVKSITMCKTDYPNYLTASSINLGMKTLTNIPLDPIRVRKNVYVLTTTEIDAYRKAVEKMKNWSTVDINDPIGWTYQAAIHKTTTTPVQLLWNQCPHHVSQSVFLAWHRVYLYFFERIIRKAAQEAGVSTFNTLALPYWNYSKAGQAKLPAAFRSPANTTNALYDSRRLASLNTGTTALPPSAITITNTMTTTSFTGAINIGFNNTVESVPHDAVHGTIGGDMGHFETAALDPIFWLHHANIDRLWEAWLRQGGGRTNPTTNTSWMNIPYTFFDENRNQVTLTISQILDIQTQLRYKYDDMISLTPHFIPPIAMNQQPTRTKLFTQEQFNINERFNKTELNNFSVLDEVANKKSIKNKNSKSRYTLSLEDIDVAEVPEGVYEIYICLPSTIKNPTYKSNHYVGIFSTIGVQKDAGHPGHQNVPIEYDVTNQIKNLRYKNVDVGKFSVTFRLVGADLNPKKGIVKIKTINLYAED